MSQLLRLYITPAWPGQDPACEWALIGAQGSVLQQGRSEPRHWPPAEHCEIVLSAEQCLLLPAGLPKGARSRPPEVIAYALEDQLAGDAEDEHFVIGADERTEGAVVTRVWVISRARLKVLLSALNALGRTPRRAVGELLLVPLPSDGWSVCLHADGTTGCVRIGPEEGYSLDLADPAQPPLELVLALQAARQKDRAPGSIEICTARGRATQFAAAGAAAWQHALGVPVRLGAEFVWYERSAERARNLLTGEFAPARAPDSDWRSLKPALLLGLAALSAYTVFSFGEWMWLAGQRDELRGQMTDIFRTAYPHAQAIVDPPLQMRRLGDQAHRKHGLLGSDDFLPLLATAGEALAGRGVFNHVGYEEGRLDITLVLADAHAAQRVRDALAGRGLDVTLRDVVAAGAGVRATYALRAMP